jgi:hypothetical protein
LERLRVAEVVVADVAGLVAAVAVAGRCTAVVGAAAVAGHPRAVMSADVTAGVLLSLSWAILCLLQVSQAC